MDLNAELLREISTIISDRELTEKTLEFVRSLRRRRPRTCTKDVVTEEETIGKEEMKAMLREGLRDVKEGRVRPVEELLNEL